MLDSNGCLDNTCNLAVGIAKKPMETMSLDIYPNPVKDVLNIENKAIKTYAIYNITGDLIFRGWYKDGSTVAILVQEFMYWKLPQTEVIKE